MLRPGGGQRTAGLGEELLDGLERALASRFSRYELQVVGTVALFTSWVE
jgi:hypothetical protein